MEDRSEHDNDKMIILTFKCNYYCLYGQLSSLFEKEMHYYIGWLAYYYLPKCLMKPLISSASLCLEETGRNAVLGN